MANSDWPIIHLYGPDWPHGEQIIACNEAGLQLLQQLVLRERNPVEPFTDDGEGFNLCLLVTEETEKLPSPYTDTEVFGESDRTWLIQQIRRVLGIKTD